MKGSRSEPECLVKVKATFVLDEELLIRLKMAAVKGRKSYSEAVEELIRKQIGGRRG